MNSERKTDHLTSFQFKKGVSGNPLGRPKGEGKFKALCRKFVDEVVLAEWQKEVNEHGDKWFEASKLLAAYGYGLPKEMPEHVDEEPTVPTAEEAAAAAQELRELSGAH